MSHWEATRQTALTKTYSLDVYREQCLLVLFRDLSLNFAELEIYFKYLVHTDSYLINLWPFWLESYVSVVIPLTYFRIVMFGPTSI